MYSKLLGLAVLLLFFVTVYSENGIEKQEEKQENIDIVFCVTSHYMEGMGASIISIIRAMHSPDQRLRLRFMIMVAQPAELWFLKSWIEGLLITHFHHSVARPLLAKEDFIVVRLFEPPPNHPSKLFALRQGSVGDKRLNNIMNAARFYIHEVFPELKKFVYLDADLILHQINLTRIFDQSLVGYGQPQIPNMAVHFYQVQEFYRNRAMGNTSAEDVRKEFWDPSDMQLLNTLKGPENEPILLSGYFYFNQSILDKEPEENTSTPFDGTFCYGNFFIVDQDVGGRMDPFVERLFDVAQPAFYGGFWITDMREWIRRNITGRVEEWLIHHNKFKTGIFKGLTNAPLLAVFYNRWENIALREPDIKFAHLLGYSNVSYELHHWNDEILLNSPTIFEWQGPRKPWLERGQFKEVFSIYKPQTSWREHIMWKIKSKVSRPAPLFAYIYDLDDIFTIDVLDSLSFLPPSVLL